MNNHGLEGGKAEIAARLNCKDEKDMNTNTYIRISSGSKTR